MAAVDYGTAENEPRTNGEQSEIGDDFRVSFESRKKRDPFRFEQPSPEEFRRIRRTIPQSRDARYTYFMRDRRTGLIKIGMSGDPERRRAELSGSGALDMDLLLILRDGNLEGCYHQHFADLRATGEWFYPHPDILAEIERLSAL